MEKSERTPYLSSHHAPIGHEGLWHTPSKKVPEKQQLPALMPTYKTSATPCSVMVTESRRRMLSLSER